MSQSTSPHVIDPAKPFGSVASGPQQFTILGDFDHTNPELMKSVRDNVKAMAQAGKKHIMLELTEDPRSKTLLNYINTMPSLVSDKVIMAEAPNLALSNPKTAEEQKLSGEYIAGVLVEAKNNGMKVHFVNDDRGMAESDIADALIKKRDEFVSTYTQGDPKLRAWLENGLEDSSKHSRDMQKKIMEKRQGLLDGLEAHDGPIAEAQKKYLEARMGVEAETARAEKIVRLANGEKTAVMFGAGHFIKDRDLNELIDEKAKQRDPSRPYVPSVVMALHGSRDHFERDELLYENITEPDLKYFVQEKQIELTQAGARTMTMGGAATVANNGQGISFGNLEQMAGALAGSRTQGPAAEAEITKASAPAPQAKPKAIEYGM